MKFMRRTPKYVVKEKVILPDVNVLNCNTFRNQAEKSVLIACYCPKLRKSARLVTIWLESKMTRNFFNSCPIYLKLKKEGKI